MYDIEQSSTCMMSNYARFFMKLKSESEKMQCWQICVVTGAYIFQTLDTFKVFFLH